jgi:hypothetical protein
MSRTYRLYIEVQNIDTGDHPPIEAIAEEWFGDIEYTYRHANSIHFSGRGHLGGGMSEQEAHNEIKAQIEAIKPKAKVITRWQMLEEYDFVFGEDEKCQACNGVHTGWECPNAH